MIDFEITVAWRRGGSEAWMAKINVTLTDRSETLHELL